MLVLSFEAVVLQPSLPLMGLGVRLEIQLTPFRASIANVNMVTMLVLLYVTTNALHDRIMAFRFLCFLEVGRLPLWQAKTHDLLPSGFGSSRDDHGTSDGGHSYEGK